MAFFLSILAASRLQADNLYAYRDSVKNGYNFLLYVPDSYETSESDIYWQKLNHLRSTQFRFLII